MSLNLQTLSIAQKYTDQSIDKIKTLKGEKGDPGITPTIGTNGNWFLDKIDTGISAKGEKGDDGYGFAISKIYDSIESMKNDTDINIKDGMMLAVFINGSADVYIKDSSFTIPSNNESKDEIGFRFFLNLTDATIIKGQDGQTPIIGENGNWFINGSDTNVFAGLNQSTDALKYGKFIWNNTTLSKDDIFNIIPEVGNLYEKDGYILIPSGTYYFSMSLKIDDKTTDFESASINIVFYDINSNTILGPEITVNYLSCSPNGFIYHFNEDTKISAKVINTSIPNIHVINKNITIFEIGRERLIGLRSTDLICDSLTINNEQNPNIIPLKNQQIPFTGNTIDIIPINSDGTITLQAGIYSAVICHRINGSIVKASGNISLALANADDNNSIYPTTISIESSLNTDTTYSDIQRTGIFKLDKPTRISLVCANNSDGLALYTAQAIVTIIEVGKVIDQSNNKPIDISQDINNAIIKKSDGIYVTDFSNDIEEIKKGLSIKGTSTLYYFARSTSEISKTITTNNPLNIFNEVISSNGLYKSNSNHSVKLKANKTYLLESYIRFCKDPGAEYYNFYDITHSKILPCVTGNSDRFNLNYVNCSKAVLIITPEEDIEIDLVVSGMSDKNGTTNVQSCNKTISSNSYIYVCEIGGEQLEPTINHDYIEYLLARPQDWNINSNNISVTIDTNFNLFKYLTHISTNSSNIILDQSSGILTLPPNRTFELEQNIFIIGETNNFEYYYTFWDAETDNIIPGTSAGMGSIASKLPGSISRCTVFTGAKGLKVKSKITWSTPNDSSNKSLHGSIPYLLVKELSRNVHGLVELSPDKDNAIIAKDNGIFVSDLSQKVENAVNLYNDINFAQKTVNQRGVKNLLTSEKFWDINPAVTNGNSVNTVINENILLVDDINKYDSIQIELAISSNNRYYGRIVHNIISKNIIYNPSDSIDPTNGSTLFLPVNLASNNNGAYGSTFTNFTLYFKNSNTLRVATINNPNSSIDLCKVGITSIIGIKLDPIVIDPLEYVNDESGIEASPVGQIISFMGSLAPKHYLICDGSIYNIKDYPYLANHFKEQFGLINYFGGDGTTTFAVPDLRNEFIRGYHGTAIRQLSGEIGNHQDATQIPRVIPYSDGNTYQALMIDFNDDKMSPLVGIDSSGQFRSTNGRLYKYIDLSPLKHDDPTINSGYAYTVKPTNVAVLFCIKAEPTFYMNISGKQKYIDLYSSETVQNEGDLIYLNDSIKNYDQLIIETAVHNNITNINSVRTNIPILPKDVIYTAESNDMIANATVFDQRRILAFSFVDEYTIKISLVDIVSNNTQVMITKVVGIQSSSEKSYNKELQSVLVEGILTDNINQIDYPSGFNDKNSIIRSFNIIGDSGLFIPTQHTASVYAQLQPDKIIVTQEAVSDTVNLIGKKFLIELAKRSAVIDKSKYSTEESPIGTWVNGKTIYRKIFTIATDILPSNDFIVGNIENIDTLVKLEGTLRNKDTETFFALAYCAGIETSSGYVDINGNVHVQNNFNQIIIDKGNIMVEYTKV